MKSDDGFGRDLLVNFENDRAMRRSRIDAPKRAPSPRGANAADRSDRDLRVWAAGQMALIKKGQTSGLDFEGLLVSLNGLRIAREERFRSDVATVVGYLLAWRIQPSARNRHRRLVIDGKRLDAGVLLDESPSVIQCCDSGDAWQSVWLAGVSEAAAITGLSVKTFARNPLWSLEETLREGFYPEN